MRKIACVILSIIFMLLVHISVDKPVFIDESDSVTLYLGNNSSICEIISIDNGDYHKYSNIRGESIRLELTNFDLDAFIKKYTAQILFIEQIEQGVNYYCYSPKMKYRRLIDGFIINLHVFVGNECVSIGTPMIFGSF